MLAIFPCRSCSFLVFFSSFCIFHFSFSYTIFPASFSFIYRDYVLIAYPHCNRYFQPVPQHTLSWRFNVHNVHTDAHTHTHAVSPLINESKISSACARQPCLCSMWSPPTPPMRVLFARNFHRRPIYMCSFYIGICTFHIAMYT